MIKSKKKLQFGIRGKILMIFSAFSLICLAVIAGIVGGYMRAVDNTITNESESALTDQIKINLIKSASENALAIGEKINNVIADVEALAFFAENLFENPGIYGPYPSYNDTDYFAPGLDVFMSAEYGNNFISFEYSMYHLAPEAYNVSEGYASANSTVQNLVNVSANLDHMLKYTKEANPDLAWIYMGFEKGGIFRCYPWAHFDTNYDPRIRPWYDFTGVPIGDIKITDPYIDANGLGLMITLAKEVYNGAELVGVIAVDLTITQIEETILNIQFLETGYAFLINEEGLTIAHQDQDLEDLELGEDLSTNIQDLESFDSSVYTALITNENGFEAFEKTDGDETIMMYMAYSKIENTDYIVATVVPEEEAVASVSELSNNIAKATRKVNATLIVIIIIAGIVSAGIGTIIAGQITKPVGILTRSIQKLTKQDAIRTIMESKEDIHIDVSLENKTDEIGDLTRAFKGMLNAIKKDYDESNE